MIVWGGHFETPYPDDQWGQLNDGAAYDPATNRWHPISRAPISERDAQVAVWSGTEMIIWGGTNSPDALQDGAAFNPVTNEWRTLAPAPFTLQAPLGVWTGEEMVIIGTEFMPDAVPRERVRAIAYDPARDGWRAIPDVPIENDPDPTAPGYISDVAVIDGHVILEVQYARSRAPVSLSSAARILVWDIARQRWFSPDEFRFAQGAGITIAGIGDEVLVRVTPRTWDDPAELAYRYRPATATVTPSPPIYPHTSGPNVWTGRHVIYLGDHSDKRPVALNPQTQTWKRVDVTGASEDGASMIWTGTQVIIWGGTTRVDEPTGRQSLAVVNTGVAFTTPSADSPGKQCLVAPGATGPLLEFASPSHPEGTTNPDVVAPIGAPAKPPGWTAQRNEGDWDDDDALDRVVPSENLAVAPDKAPGVVTVDAQQDLALTNVNNRNRYRDDPTEGFALSDVTGDSVADLIVVSANAVAVVAGSNSATLPSTLDFAELGKRPEAWVSESVRIPSGGTTADGRPSSRRVPAGVLSVVPLWDITGDGINDFALDGTDPLGRGVTGTWYYAGKPCRDAAAPAPGACLVTPDPTGPLLDYQPPDATDAANGPAEPVGAKPQPPQWTPPSDELDWDDDGTLDRAVPSENPAVPPDKAPGVVTVDARQDFSVTNVISNNRYRDDPNTHFALSDVTGDDVADLIIASSTTVAVVAGSNATTLPPSVDFAALRERPEAWVSAAVRIPSGGTYADGRPSFRHVPSGNLSVVPLWDITGDGVNDFAVDGDDSLGRGRTGTWYYAGKPCV